MSLIAKYNFVPEHNGIEIYFDEKPSNSILEELKSNGWRWHSSKKCWFTRRSNVSESLAKKLCFSQTTPSSIPQQTSSVSVQQYFGSALASMLTISKNEQKYCLSSTNNQIICCDCNRFFSIHAIACPFCGCPIDYIAKYYYLKYDPEIISKQQDQHPKQKLTEQRLTKENAERKEKEELIQSIAELTPIASWKLKAALQNQNNKTLTQIKERANKLKALHARIAFLDDTYIELLCCTDNHFEKVFQRISKIKALEHLLPAIGSKEWSQLETLDDTNFISRIYTLIADEGIRRKKAAEYLDKKEKHETDFRVLCRKYHIEPTDLQAWIDRYGSKEAFFHKLQVVDTIGGNFCHRVNPIRFIDSPDSLRKLIKNLM